MKALITPFIIMHSSIDGNGNLEEDEDLDHSQGWQRMGRVMCEGWRRVKKCLLVMSQLMTTYL